MSEDKTSSKASGLKKYPPQQLRTTRSSSCVIYPSFFPTYTTCHELSLTKPTASQNPTLEDYKDLVRLSASLISCFEFKTKLSVNLSPEKILNELWTADISCIEANPAFASSRGFESCADLIGLPFNQLFPKDALNLQVLSAWVNGNFNLANYEPDGFITSSEDKVHRFSLYTGFEGSLIRKLWFIAVDITAQRNAVKELERAEAYYKNLVERPGLALIRSRPDGSYIYLSPHVEDIHGYKPEEFDNNPGLFRRLIHPEDVQKHEAIYTARRTRSTRPVEVEYRIRRKDGNYHWFFERQTARVSESGEVEYYDSVAFDIQDRKELEASLVHAQRMEVVGAFAGGIAHDFNNHLTAILGQITLVLNELDPANSCYSKIAEAERAALACAEMTAHLLSFGRKNEPGELKPLSAQKLVNETSSLLKHLLPATIDLRLSIPERMLVLQGSFSQLQQVIMNLAINARDAMPRGGKLEINLEKVSISNHSAGRSVVDSYPDAPLGEYVEISVKDSGEGIPEANLPKLFQPFFTTKEVGKGSGLGLSMVYSIIKNHKGHLKVLSKEAAGSTFSILLPLAEDEIPVQTFSEPEVAPSGCETILVAEDDAMVLSVAETALKMHGYRVVTACDGVQAIAVFNENMKDIRLALIDQTMPGLSGREVCNHIMNCAPDTRLILTSGGMAPASISRLKTEEPFMFVSKPYSLPFLLSLIRKMLDGAPVKVI
jgi:PAS domain S-box-containing protein